MGTEAGNSFEMDWIQKESCKWDESVEAASLDYLVTLTFPPAVATIVHDVRLTIPLISSGGSNQGCICRPRANDKRLGVGKVMR